jgi:hypothetical protein
VVRGWTFGVRSSVLACIGVEYFDICKLESFGEWVYAGYLRGIIRELLISEWMAYLRQ